MKSKFTPSSGFVALLLLIATVGRVLAFTPSPEDSISALYIREGAKQLRNILDRREANRAAGVPDDNVYVIDFAEILNNAEGSVEYYTDSTSVPQNIPSDWPSGYNPKKWSDDTKESIRQHMIGVNSDPILSGTAIIVGLNLYLGKAHKENDIIEFDASQNVYVRKRSRNTTEIQSKLDQLKATLLSIANQVSGGKYIFVAGGYFIQDDINNKSITTSIWYHQTKNLDKEILYSPIIGRLNAIPHTNVKDQVSAYTTSILYVLKGLDKTVLNLSSNLNGGADFSTEQISKYTSFLNSLGEIADPSKIKIIFYDNDAQLDILSTDNRYKGMIDPKFTFYVKVNANGEIVHTKAEFIEPPGLLSQCRGTAWSGANEALIKFRGSALYKRYETNAFERLNLELVYVVNQIEMQYFLCLTSRENANSYCCSTGLSCDACQFAAGTFNGIVSNLDFIGASEIGYEILYKLLKWQLGIAKKRLRDFASQSIIVIPQSNSQVSSDDYANNPTIKLLKPFAHGLLDIVENREDLKKIENRFVLGYYIAKNAVQSITLDVYTYGWVTGLLLTMAIAPENTTSTQAQLSAKLGVALAKSGNRLLASDLAWLRSTLKKIDDGASFIVQEGGQLAKSVDKDGVVRVQLSVEQQMISILEQNNLLDKVKNLPEIPTNLQNTFINDFSSINSTNYDILARLLSKDISIDAWSIFKKLNQEKYAKSAADLVELTKDLKRYSGLKPLLDDPEIFSFWDLARKDIELAKEQFVDILDAIVPGSTLDKFQKTEYFLQNYKPNIDLGIAFEEVISTGFKDKNSFLYKKVLSVVPDLSDRTILRKVYLCLSGNCKDKGTYFISDFGFFKNVVDDLGNHIGWDVVLADSKLNEITRFTTNQNAGKKLNAYKLKSLPKTLDNVFFNDIEVGTIISRSTDPNGLIKPYYKLYSDGNGAFSNISQ